MVGGNKTYFLGDPKGYNAANAKRKYLQANKTTEAREGSLVQMALLPLPSSLHRHASGIGETQEGAGKLGGRQKRNACKSLVCNVLGGQAWGLDFQLPLTNT